MTDSITRQVQVPDGPTIRYTVYKEDVGNFHMNVWGPLADWSTGGYLHDTIFHPTGFAVGSTMLYANAFFRDGHKYQDIIGVLNSWFLGMFLLLPHADLRTARRHPRSLRLRRSGVLHECPRPLLAERPLTVQVSYPFA